MSKRFQRNIEDFTCNNCGFFVVGNGYTNHCSKCLWSRHVDNNPGDRESPCGGMMQPVRVENVSGETFLIHKCSLCQKMMKNKVSNEDNFDIILEITKNPLI